MAGMMENFYGFEPVRLDASGVYLLIQGETVVYVGKSVYVPSRIRQHISRLRQHNKGKPASLIKGDPVIPFDRAVVKWAGEDELDELEYELIMKYQPMFNKKLIRRAEPLVHVDFDKLGNGKWKDRWQKPSNGLKRRSIRVGA